MRSQSGSEHTSLPHSLVLRGIHALCQCRLLVLLQAHCLSVQPRHWCQCTRCHVCLLDSRERLCLDRSAMLERGRTRLGRFACFWSMGSCYHVGNTFWEPEHERGGKWCCLSRRCKRSSSKHAPHIASLQESVHSKVNLAQILLSYLK